MSGRCHLGELVPSDLPHLIALDTSPEVRAFLGGALEPSIARERSEALLSGEPASPHWAIRREGDDAFLGLIALHPHHHSSDTEVSYALLPEHLGQGYATVALKAVLDHAFEVLLLPEVVAETQVANIRSCRLLERVGMREKQRLVRCSADQIVYAIGPAGLT